MTAQRPSPARMWNYLQGGKDHYQVDRDAGDAMAEANPDMFYLARQVRQFFARTVRWVAAEAGVRQFLDLGCGLPAPVDAPNTCEIAQSVHPAARIVYVDNDKVVLAHARALLTPATDLVKCAYIDSDVREIDAILAEAGRTLDLTEPVGVLMLGILGALEYDQALAVLERVTAAVPSGSYLVVEDGVDTGRVSQAGITRRHQSGVDRYELRTLDQMHGYFEGWELVEPGLVTITAWRPGAVDVGTIRPVDPHGGVARKP
ncbi:SAM-dependent methyltransferase [Pseudonocardia acaciae]|uniref:SAM-dependent methyltransferase n=1 Tax=Pseudonocardia acaciae TaxID=551276 RepID=UPI001B80CD37|nr:SAM-dependent methyltransferase [Pseudonocardia acaciae]